MTAESHQSTEHGAKNSVCLLTHEDGIATLTLNRPAQYNVLSHEMLDSLQTALDSLNDECRLVVIAANGKAFCAGHDLKEMRANIDQAWQAELFAKCSHFMNTLLNIPQPVIAKVQGIATAAGCQLVANCDLAIAAKSARFAVSGINIGLFCSTPSVPLSRNIHRKRAFEMLMTGDFIDANTATEWGLINKAVDDKDLDKEISIWCDKIKAKSKVAVTTGKALFYKQLELPIEEAYEIAAESMACNMMAEDVSIGIDAFKEKREPLWKHR